MSADAAAPPPGWVRREIEGFAALTGPFWQLREASGWAYGVLATRDHANVHGIVHGGMLVTLLDNALGLTVFEAAGRVPCVTMQLNTQFLAAARPGEFLEARGEVLRRARSVVFVRGVLTAGGRMVAAADGVWKLLGTAREGEAR